MPDSERVDSLRASGYVGRLQELGYGIASPLYDLFVSWAMLPIGGEAHVRSNLATWLEARPGNSVISLCCGTGTTDRAVLKLEPSTQITGLDLGQAQIQRAKQKDTSGKIAYRIGNAAETNLDAESFDRVMLVGALHEMPRELRARVLAEARRLIKPDGRFLTFEPCRTGTRWTAFVRSLVLFLWLPGNPETKTTHDLIDHGLDTELHEAGFDLVKRHHTKPDWFESILARPA